MTSTADLVTDSVGDLPEKVKNENNGFRQMPIRQKIAYIREFITVEPVIALYFMATILCGPALQTLELEKTCRANLGHNDTVCVAIRYSETDNYSEANEEATVIISNMHSWQLPVQSFVPLILVLFLGSFSDRHQIRKPFMLLPLFGELFAVCGCILSVIFMKEWTLEVQGFLQTVVPSFFGGPTMMIMAIFSYIADVSSVEMRTLRIGIVQVILTTVNIFSNFVSGMLFRGLDYIGVFVLASALFLMAILYCAFRIKESKQPVTDTKKNILLDIVDPTNVTDTFSLLFKKNPKNDRVFLVLVLILFFVVSGIATAEFTLNFLYTQNIFQWTSLEFSYLATCSTIIQLIGTSISVPIFTKVLQLSDLNILMITFLDKIMSNSIFGFANSTAIIYLAFVLSIFSGVTIVALRSVATKIVSEADLGKAQSLFGISEAIGISVMTPFYNSVIYVNTFRTSFPSAYLFVGAAIYACCSILLLLMYLRNKKHVEKPEINGTDKSLPMEEMQVTHM